MSSPRLVNEEHLYLILEKLRDLRRWALDEKIDPWAFRHALLFVEELDREAALDHGVGIMDLIKFDLRAREEARAWLEKRKE